MGNETLEEKEIHKCMFCGEKKTGMTKVGKKYVCGDCAKELTGLKTG